MGKPTLARVELEQTMNRLSEVRSALRHASGGPSGWGSQQNLSLLGLEDGDKGPQNCGLSGSGTPGEYRNLGKQSLSNSFGLSIGKSEPCLFLSPVDGLFDPNRRQGGLCVKQSMERAGQGLFGPGTGGQLHPILCGGDQVAALKQSVNPLVDIVGIGLEQIGRQNHQFPSVDVVVPLILGFLHGVEDACLDAFGSVVGQSEIQGNPIRGLESDSLDLTNDAVGIRLKDRFGGISVLSDQAQAERIGDFAGDPNEDYCNRCFLDESSAI